MTPYSRSDPLVVQIATQYNLRTDLLAAQIQVESAGDPFAFRWEPEFYRRYIKGRDAAVGAKFGPLAACSYGLLQILLETAMELGFAGRPEDLFIPRIGLAWGAKYLQRCLLLSDGDYRRGLQRYNGAGQMAEAYATRVFTMADQQKQDGTMNA